MAHPPTTLPSRFVLVLCGLVGAGKSTFADALVSYQPTRWVRCCQDELKSRSKVEDRVRLALAQGYSPIVDRTDVTAEQREPWVNIARECRVPVYLLFLNTRPEECALRVHRRRKHPTVKTGAQGVGLIRSFGASFEPPTVDEGFDRIHSYEPPAAAAPTSPAAPEEPAPAVPPSSSSSELAAPSESYFSPPILEHILEQLELGVFLPDQPLFQLSGPLPALPPRKSTKKQNAAVTHGMDIRKCFPPKSADLVRNRALRATHAANTAATTPAAVAESGTRSGTSSRSVESTTHDQAAAATALDHSTWTF